MLGYEEFKKQFADQLQKELAPDGIILTETQMLKVNGPKDGFTVRFPDSDVGPVIYIDEDYKDYRLLDRPVDAIAKDRADNIRNIKTQIPDMPQLTWDKDRLYACVVNQEYNQEILKNAPHKKVEDLAIIVRYRVSEDSNMLVNNDLCAEAFKMTSEELLEVARENTYRQGYKCMSLGKMLGGFMQDSGASEDYLNEMQLDGPAKSIMVLTNPDMVDGASLGTDPRVMEEMHGLIGGDFYVLPSSRHELLLVPEDMGLDREELQDMVRSANQIAVSSYDFLSNNVYECRGPEMELTIAGKDMEKNLEPAMEKSLGHSR